MAASAPHVAVIGAGIIGSSVAANLIKKGCRVTVLEAAPHPAQGATAKSWAWLNANRKKPDHYKELNSLGMEEWRRLPVRAKSGDALAEFPGTLYLGDDRDADPSYPSTFVTAEEVADLEPELASAEAAGGARLYQQEGYGYLSSAAAEFLQQAEDAGAIIQAGTLVTGFTREEGTVSGVVTSSGKHAVDKVVLAAGLGIPELAEKLGATVPLADRPGTLTVLTQPLPKILHHIIVNDEAFIMQRRDGEVMISFFKAAVNHSPDPKEGDLPADSVSQDTAASVQQAAKSAQEHPEEAKEVLEATDVLGQEVIARAARLVPALTDASLGSVSLAKYPYPADAHPILGWLPGVHNVYVAVTHSGATLGPLIGRLVAEEVAEGTSLEQLKPYRPDRDFSDTSYFY